MLLFVIASLQGATPLPLFHKYFNIEDSLGSKDSFTDPGDAQKARKQKMMRVIERLHSVYQFFAATNVKSLEFDMQLLNSDNVVPELETGHFKMYQGDPFHEDMRVIWTSVNGLGLAFVCYGYENRVQAGISLRVLVRKLHEACRFILQPNELLNKPEKVDILLNKFVPNGNALLMNHRVIRQLEREAEILLKAVGN